MHMFEAFKHSDVGEAWYRFLKFDPEDSRRPQVDALLSGYRAGVDAPVCFAVPEILAAYPDAKIIHTYRPAQDWLRSTAVLLQVLSPFFGALIYLVPEVRLLLRGQASHSRSCTTSAVLAASAGTHHDGPYQEDLSRLVFH